MSNPHKSALEAFISAVHASGGYVDDDFWEAYTEACDALGMDPMERPEE